MWAPALRPDDIEAERTVILDEILMHADEPADLAAERWQSALFPEHPLGRDTLGTASSVRRITRDDVAASSRTTTGPATWSSRSAGDCTHDRVAADARASASPERREARRRRARLRDPTPSPLDVVRRPTEQAHLVYGARSVSRFDERRWALSVLNHVLGGGLSSRLFQKVREQRGLAYSVWSERAAYADAGLAGRGRGDGARARRRGAAHRRTASSSCWPSDGITERELAVAKGYLRAEMLLSGEDSGARMSRSARRCCCTARC